MEVYEHNGEATLVLLRVVGDYSEGNKLLSCASSGKEANFKRQCTLEDQDPVVHIGARAYKENIMASHWLSIAEEQPVLRMEPIIHCKRSPLLG